MPVKEFNPLVGVGFGKVFALTDRLLAKPALTDILLVRNFLSESGNEVRSPHFQKNLYQRLHHLTFSDFFMPIKRQCCSRLYL